MCDENKSKHQLIQELSALRQQATRFETIEDELRQTQKAWQTEIVERKQVEETLRKNEERYRKITELISDFAFSCQVEPDGTWWTEWSTEDSFSRLTGYASKEVDNTVKLYHPEDAKIVKQHLEETLQGQSRGGEYRIITKSGATRWLHIRRESIWDEKENRVIHFYGVAQDITERKQAEQDRIELALEKERVKILSDFITHASHEFRTPLATINTSIYLLDKTPDIEERKQRLVRMQEQVKHIVRLVDDLATMTRLENHIEFSSGHIQINDLMHAIVRKLQPTVADKELSVQLSLEDNLPEILGEINDLEMAIKHLVNNALRYTPATGSITINTCANEESVVVEVHDSGAGMSEKVMSRIFERFYRLDEAHSTPGFGLGLPIAQKIVERHGGKIEVESKIGQGSIFTILLPVAPQMVK
jgi:PAS domain S-box-containing protein